MPTTKERLRGSLFLFVGVFASIQSVSLPLGVLEKPGPGMFPFERSILHSAIGAFLLISAMGRSQIDSSAILRQKAEVSQNDALAGFFIEPR